MKPNQTPWIACTLLTCAATLLSAATPDVRDKSETPFTIRSSTFKDGELMPVRVSNRDRPGGPANCVGQNVSPQLSWSEPPEGTKSYALMAVNMEGHAGLGYVNMLVYGIPADVRSFAEGELGKASDRFTGGSGAMKDGTFSGPCVAHNWNFHYTFMVIATTLEPGELPAGLTLPQLQARLEGHVRRAAAIVGRFTHP